MQRIKNFWRSSTTSISPPDTTTPQIKQQSSLLQQASNYLSAYRKQNIVLTTQQFTEYLILIPQQYQKFKKNYYQRKNKKSFQSLKPELVKRVYQKVQNCYFSQKFQITPQFFQKNKKINKQKQIAIYESLDEVEVALFNQITARFDQILSVLRTVECLDCLVDFNLQKIKKIRRNNMQVVKNVADKQVRIVKTIEKKKNLEQSIKYLSKLKIYQQFLKNQQLSVSTTGSEQKQSVSTLYQSIQDVKKQVDFLGRLSCCKMLDTQIEATEQDLKKSFSESLNQLIYEYTVGKISNYRRSYWQKFRFKHDILEEEQKGSQEGTVILDESTIVEEDHGHNQFVKLSLNQQSQKVILKYIMRGWNEGQYAVAGLKLMIEKHLKSIHMCFMNDFRQFCQSYLKNRERQVQNPCLQQLLQQFNISFFTKCCLYYSSLFQNLLYRLSSITSKGLIYVINTSSSQSLQQSQLFTIQQKQKLHQILDGIINVLTFVWKSIIDKFNQLLQSKQIQQNYDIADFKAFINVIENFQQFFQKKILPNLQAIQCPNTSFLYEKYLKGINFFSTLEVTTFKKAKLLEYLSKMHKNAIQIQLKQSLENEIWTPTDIPTFYYDSLHYLITGQSLNLRRNKGLRSTNTSSMMNGNTFMYDTSVLMESMYKQASCLGQKKNQMSSNFRIIRTQILIENQTFKITQTVLLLLQIVQDYMLLNQFYPQISQQIALRIFQIFRSYNASSLQLIVHAGAVVLGKIKTKSITAKHLALSTLCLKFCVFVLECIKKRITLKDYNKLVKDIEDHAQTTIKKLETILKSKISQSIPQIKLETSPTKGTQSIVNSCKILHDILIDFFDKNILKKIFTKQIFVQYIGKIGGLRIQNRMNAQTLKDDINFFFNELKFMQSLIQNLGEYRVEAENIMRKIFEEL